MSGPLLPQDPAAVGGHRLLARLGAGGMGVVYLGRAPSGALAAVKAVHPELAGEPDFRIRFRREAEAAGRVRSPWVTPVTASGPDDPTPWLATAFVPGPSLAEAVQQFGPLPAASVRHLGRTLGAALHQVHRAGLVHRDVKPGNVLLAVDGPRLIDFGIARSVGQTLLTGVGVVAGTPGFLSPEQAEAHSELGPASDVFSLGCLLVHAATGRLPFGSGTAEALLYRTVHDEPDLAGLDGADAAGGYGDLLGLLRACLAKDPAGRPSAAEVEQRLATTADREGGWLPGPIVQHIADHSARMLALPDIEPTLAELSPLPAPPPAPGTPPRQPGTPQMRRRILALASGGAVLAAATGTGLWYATRDRGTPAAHRPAHALAVHADLSGPGRNTGREQERGARIAVEEYNSRVGKPFELGLKTADDGGSATRSRTVARRLGRDPEVLAVLGPTGDAAAEAAADAYDTSRTPVLFVVPGGVRLLLRPCRTAVHCRARDADVAFRIVVHLAKKADAAHTGMLVDLGADWYAWEVSEMTADTLRQAEIPLYPRAVPAGTRQLDPTVDDILDADVDSFVFAGYAAGAAKAARRLAWAGFTGPRMGAQALLDPVFLKQAGKAAEGWTLTSCFVDPAAVPAAARFTKLYRTRFGTAPGRFAAEAYDAARLTLDALTSGHGTPPTGPDLVTRLRASRHRGITKTYAFDPSNGRFTGEGVFMYRVEDGAYRFRGAAPTGE